MMDNDAPLLGQLRAGINPAGDRCRLMIYCEGAPPGMNTAIADISPDAAADLGAKMIEWATPLISTQESA